MDNLHFGARSRRKVKRRQITIAAWLIGVVATIYGVPGSNAALSVLHKADRSHSMTAGTISSGHSLLGPWPMTAARDEIPMPPKLAPNNSRNDHHHATSTKKKRPEHKPAPKDKSKPKHQPAPAPAPSPSPTPTPAPAPAAPVGSISSVVYSAAAEVGLDGSYLLSVARCESSLNPQAYNSGGYYGLFQFDQQTWSAYGYGSIYDPVAQSRTAARLIAAGQTSRWPTCG